MNGSRRLLFALTLLAACVAWGLGLWQVNRLLDRRARNDLARSQADVEAVDLSVRNLEGRVSYRRVRVAGEYDHLRQVVVRGRLLHGTPGVQIVTPLRIPGRDTALLVNRGFVPTPDAGFPLEPARFAEPGVVSVDGVAIDIPDEGDGQPLVTGLGETWRRLDYSQMAPRFPYPIWHYYVIATVDTGVTREHSIRGTTLPVRIEPPPLDDGPHLSYAVQWFMIGGAALGFGLVFGRRRRPDSLVPG